MKGKLILVPAPISESDAGHYLPPHSLETIHQLSHFIAERAKTARRFLKNYAHPTPMPEIQIKELSKHGDDHLADLLQWCEQGFDTGLISEAGVPGVADPGGDVVREAHRRRIEVVPLVGPSSILLALMSSGMNGQRFMFHGYLPRNESELAKELRRLEADAVQTKTTHLFIETPYRNEKMLDALLKHLHPQTDVGVAKDILGSSQKIVTMSAAEWKKMKFIFDRKPAVFLISASI